MGSHQPIRKTVTPEIPDKLYFRIGDVARLCEVPAYVLRFWETEFPQLRPNKGGTGQRLYRKRDVEMALRIKSLLYDQGYTIPGARQVFKNEAKSKEAAAAEPAPAEVAAAVAPVVSMPQTEATDAVSVVRHDARLRDLRDEMRSLLTILSNPVGATIVNADKVQPFRPRLFMEPRLTIKADHPRLRLAQRDLFTPESAPIVPEPAE